MDKFEGFTDEEIKNFTSSTKVNTEEKQNPSAAVYKNLQYKSRHQNRLPRKNVARERLLKGNYNTFSSSNKDNLPKEARLHISQIPEEEELETEEVKEKNKTSQSLKSEEKTNLPSKCNETLAMKEESVISSVNIMKEVTVKSDIKSDTMNIESGEKSKEEKSNITLLPILNTDAANIDVLEEFEARQKLMEEQNRQKKEILKQALADRAKKTHEEVKRLNEIETELKKLDLLLSNDVAIIRNQIESASIDFMEAQKRYDRVEKEFLDAKLDLFNKKERKELLTRHLCTIIEQNEMRKAKKLSELLMQLEIGPKSSLITSQIKVEYKTDQEKPNSLAEHQKQEESDQRLTNIKKDQIQTMKAAEIKTKEEDSNKINS